MKLKLLLIGIALISVLVISGCVSEPIEKTVEGNEVTIELSAFRFIPNFITVQEGLPITLILVSKDLRHTFTVPELDIDVSVSAGETKEITITPDKTGEFKLLCTIIGHDALGMNGQVIVE